MKKMKIILVLSLVLSNFAFAIDVISLDSKEVFIGTISTSKNMNDLGEKVVEFTRDEFTPSIVKVRYQVRVKRIECIEFRRTGLYHHNYQRCIKTAPYFILKKKTFKMEFKYTVPLLRSESETFLVSFSQKKINRKRVVTKLIEADTVRVYEYVNKRNKLEVFIRSVRSLDFWW